MTISSPGNISKYFGKMVGRIQIEYKLKHFHQCASSVHVQQFQDIPAGK